MNAAPTINTNNTTSQKLEAYMTALQEEMNFHGSVLVAQDGKILLQKGYGMADVQKNIKNDKDTRFAIGSVTKQFTAMAIMQLYEKGKLSLDDKITKYIPDFTNGKNITLHNLLTHTSGIYNYTNLPKLYSMNEKDTNVNSVINLIKNLPLNFNPGERFEYSNSNYLLLTYVIEKVSGLSYDVYLDNYIFRPLGMNNTGDCYQNGKYVLKTVGYAGFLETTPVNDTIIKPAFGAGALYSTTGDLYKWDRALYTDKLLKKANLKKMFTGYSMMSAAYSYGYGFMVGNSAQYGNEIGHTGGTFSFTSVISRYVDKNVTIIALVNNASYDVMSLKDTLTNIVFGNKYEMPKGPKEVSIDKENYNNYIGKYTFSIGGDIEITKDGDHLFAQIPGQDKFEILPESLSKFFSKQVEGELNFNFDKDNKVVGFSLHQPGVDLMAVKQNESSKITTPIVIDQSILDSYVGTYDSGKGVIFTITTENGHLYSQLTGQDKYEIYAQTDTNFYYKVVPAEIDFNKNADGKIDSLTLKQGGVELKAVKTK
jgi:CubicO group peptidase (beta-lactamase class C family)